MKLYTELARTIGAFKRCDDANEWKGRWKEYISELVEEYFPSGSGFDSGCTLDLDASSEEKLIILAPFHAMDSNGYYAGWVNYRIAVRASLAFGVSISIQGPSHDSLKDYIADTFHDVLFHNIPSQTGGD